MKTHHESTLENFEIGAEVSIKTPTGRASKAHLNQGHVVARDRGFAGNPDRVLVETPAHPLTGCARERQWYEIDQLVPTPASKTVNQ